MSISRDHNRMSIYFQLLIISLIYIREIFLLLGMVALTTPLYYAAIALMLLWNVIQLLVKEKTDKGSIVFFVFIGTVLFYLVFESWKHQGAFNNSVGEIITVLLFLNVYRSAAKGNYELLRYNTLWNVIYAVSAFIMSFSTFSYNEYGQLVYSYGNPNLSGLSAYICLLNLVVGLFACKPNGERLATCVACILSAYICFVSKARSSLLSICIFALIGLLLYKSHGKKYAKGLAWIGPAFVVLFPPVWVIFYNLVGNADFRVLGKPIFSYRELIWNHMYEVLLQSPFGSNMGQSVVYGSGPHNVPLSIWWNYGLIAFICFCIIWGLSIAKMQSRIRHTADCAIVAAIISASVSMTFEVILFSGGLNFSFRLFYLAVFMNVVAHNSSETKRLFRPISLKQEAVEWGSNTFRTIKQLLSGFGGKQ